MKNTETFTTTISPELLKWLNNSAKKSKQTRRELLENAITLYRKNINKQNMREGFRRASEDSSNIEFSEWGMDDYSRIVKHL